MSKARDNYKIETIKRCLEDFGTTRNDNPIHEDVIDYIKELEQFNKKAVGRLEVVEVLIKGYLEKIKELEQENKWISVKDRLPEDRSGFKNVIVYIDTFIVLEATYYMKSKKFRFVHDLSSDITNVTHWMPLPKPPEV